MVQDKVKDTNHANVDHKPLNTVEKIMFRKDPDAKHSIWQSGTITEKNHERKYRVKPMTDGSREITRNRVHLKPKKIKAATKTPAKTMAQVPKLDSSAPTKHLGLSVVQMRIGENMIKNSSTCLIY